MKQIKSYAKINLSLEVLSPRDDGYHNIDTLMTRIDLWDDIYIKLNNENRLILSSSDPTLALDNTNYITQAYKLLKPYRNHKQGASIHIDKHIPVAAGLAGGTSNGIAVLKELNKLWDIHLPKENLIALAKPIGADSSFFFYSGLVRARGIGHDIEQIEVFPELNLLLINIGFPIDTSEVYRHINDYSQGKVKDLAKNINNPHYLFKNGYNSMENFSFQRYPELEKIREKLRDMGSDFVLISGSGPSLFGVFEDLEKLNDAYHYFSDRYPYVIKTKIIR